MADNLLEHISYQSYVDHYKEFLVSNYWTLDVLRFPRACYNPGKEFIKTRMNSVTGFQEPSAQILEFSIRGYSSYQTGQTSVPVSDIDLGLVDYEDSTILAFGRDWRDKQHKWSEFTANRLENCVMEATVTRCNKEGIAVRKNELRRTLFNQLTYTDDYTEESNLIGDKISISVKAIVYQKMLNVRQ